MPQASSDPVPHRVLGRTGVSVSAIGLGGWHLALKHVDEPLSLRIVRSAIDRGITFLDNSWDYNDGASEVLIARTKNDGADGRWELFKTTSIFDSTATHPDWLGEEPQRLQDMVQA